MQTHNIGVVSSIPPCVIFKTPLVRKATGNHLMNSTSLEKTQSPVSGFCYAPSRVCNAATKVGLIIRVKPRNVVSSIQFINGWFLIIMVPQPDAGLPCYSF